VRIYGPKVRSASVEWHGSIKGTSGIVRPPVYTLSRAMDCERLELGRGRTEPAMGLYVLLEKWHVQDKLHRLKAGRTLVQKGEVNDRGAALMIGSRSTPGRVMKSDVEQRKLLEISYAVDD